MFRDRCLIIGVLERRYLFEVANKCAGNIIKTAFKARKLYFIFRETPLNLMASKEAMKPISLDET